MQEKEEKGKLLKKNKAAMNAYMKYSGMGVQMALIIAAFSYLGVYLDTKFETSVLFTVIFSLSGVFLSMYIFIKKVIGDGAKSQSEDETS